MVHQHFMLVEAMTVLKILFLTIPVKSSFIPKDKLKKKILSFRINTSWKSSLTGDITDISVGAQQRVEILKALFRGADLLILDDRHTFDRHRGRRSFKIMRKLTSEHKSVIFISHKMREVLKVSDRITILRAGRTVKTLNRSETNGEELADLMIGHKMVQEEYKKAGIASGHSPGFQVGFL